VPKHLWVSILAVVAIVPVAAQTRQKAPELAKLEYFVGDTTTDGTMRLGQTSGKFTSKDHAEWMNGGYFVINRAETTTPFGPGSQIEIMGWDPIRKVYTHDAYNSGGVHTSSTGTVNGDVWTWTSADGRARQTITIQSANQFSFKFELSQDGATWMTVVEGTTTKH
jgi:Protein of unknown function (DUF1579)